MPASLTFNFEMISSAAPIATSPADPASPADVGEALKPKLNT